MKRLKDHLEKNCGLRIEYLKYQIYDITNQQTDQNDKRCIYCIIGSHSRYLSC